jgi:hypothetical protein
MYDTKKTQPDFRSSGSGSNSTLHLRNQTEILLEVVRDKTATRLYGFGFSQRLYATWGLGCRRQRLKNSKKQRVAPLNSRDLSCSTLHDAVSGTTRRTPFTEIRKLLFDSSCSLHTFKCEQVQTQTQTEATKQPRMNLSHVHSNANTRKHGVRQT